MLAELKPQTTEKLMTGEELFALGNIGRVELVAGRLINLMPTGRPHSRIEAIIALFLGMYNLSYKLGEVHTGETGIFTRRDPDTVRGMDVAFISHERLKLANAGGFLTVAPELIVEVLSPNDRWSDVQIKLAEYFAIEVYVIWVVDPKSEQVYVYRSLTDLRILTTADTLTCEEILPEFSVAVSEIFGS